MDLSLRPKGRPPSCYCGTCRKCVKAARARAAYQALSPEQRHALLARRDPSSNKRNYQRRRDTEAYRATSMRTTYRHIARHPDRVRARKMLNQAVLRGHVVRGACVVCGKKKTDAHHPDYTKPLEVIWYCRLHHVAAHR